MLKARVFYGVKRKTGNLIMQKNTILFIFSLMVSLLLNFITGTIVCTFLLEFLVRRGMKFINLHYSYLHPEIMIGVVSGILITLILLYLTSKVKLPQYKPLYLSLFSAILAMLTFSVYYSIILIAIYIL